MILSTLTTLELVMVLILLLAVLVFAVLNVLYRMLKIQNTLLRLCLGVNKTDVQLDGVPRSGVEFPKTVDRTQPQGFYDMLRTEELMNRRIKK